MIRKIDRKYGQKFILSAFLVLSMFVSQLHCLAEGLQIKSHAGHTHPGHTQSEQTTHHHHHSDNSSHNSDNSGQENLEACCQSMLFSGSVDFSKKLQVSEVNLEYIILSAFNSSNISLIKIADRHEYYEDILFSDRHFESLSLVPNAPPILL